MAADSLRWKGKVFYLYHRHCVTTADSTHMEDFTKFYCCYALVLFLCLRICNCWNFLSSPFVLPVPCNWWTKYQFHNISIAIAIVFDFTNICAQHFSQILSQYLFGTHIWVYKSNLRGYTSSIDGLVWKILILWNWYFVHQLQGTGSTKGLDRKFQQLHIIAHKSNARA